MKKCLSMVMAAAMVVSLVPATAFAASGDVKATAKVVDAENYADGKLTAGNKEIGKEAEAQLTVTTADYSSTSASTTITLTLDNAYSKLVDAQGETSTGNDGNITGTPVTIKTADGTYTVGRNGYFNGSDGQLKGQDNTPVMLKSIDVNDDKDEIEYVIAGQLKRGWTVSFDLKSDMDKISKGKTATVSVDSDDITITNGDDLVYASIESSSIKASVKKTVDVATEEMAKMNNIKIETTVGNFDDFLDGTAKEELKLKLNSGFEFALGKETAKIGGLTIDKDMIDEDEIIIKGTDFATMGITGDTIEVENLYVDAVSAKAGATATVKVYLTDCDTVSVEVAKVVDYTVSMTVDEDEDVPVIYSGVDEDDYGITADGDHDSLEVTLKETFAGAWNNSKDFELSVPEGVYITNAKVSGYEGTEANGEDWFKAAYKDGDYATLSFDRRSWNETNPDDGDDEIEIEFTLTLVADPNFEGDVVLKLSGDAVDEQEVTIAKFVKPFTVEAQQNDLQIDYRNTDIPTSVVIKEAEAGLWNKGTTFALSLDKINFDDDAKVTVDSKSGVEVKNVKTKDGVITFDIDSRSDDEPAAITISDLTLYMDRSLPAGAYDLKVYSPTMLVGDSKMVDKDDIKAPAADGYLYQSILGGVTDKDDVIAEINDDFYSTTAKAGFVNIVTAGREDTESFTTKVVVPVGESYLISGENKVTIDVPAYINANGYTMLPLRAVAVALGINSNNVLWDQSTRTATIMYGSKIINMTYGQKVVYVNGAMIPATAAVEITNDRMFLGLRDLGNALGVTDITWDAATKTATLNGNK